MIPHSADLHWEYSSSSHGDPAGDLCQHLLCCLGLLTVGSFALRAALYQQPDDDPRLGHDLGWLGLAAPGWVKEGAATLFQQRAKELHVESPCHTQPWGSL